MVLKSNFFFRMGYLDFFGGGSEFWAEEHLEGQLEEASEEYLITSERKVKADN